MMQDVASFQGALDWLPAPAPEVAPCADRQRGQLPRGIAVSANELAHRKVALEHVRDSREADTQAMNAIGSRRTHGRRGFPGMEQELLHVSTHCFRIATGQDAPSTL